MLPEAPGPRNGTARRTPPARHEAREGQKRAKQGNKKTQNHQNQNHKTQKNLSKQNYFPQRRKRGDKKQQKTAKHAKHKKTQQTDTKQQENAQQNTQKHRGAKESKREQQESRNKPGKKDGTGRDGTGRDDKTGHARARPHAHTYARTNEATLAPCATAHLHDHRGCTVVHLPLQGCVYVLEEGTLTTRDPGRSFNFNLNTRGTGAGRRGCPDKRRHLADDIDESPSRQPDAAR